MKKYLTVNHAVLLGLLAFLISNIASVANLNKRITKVEGLFSPFVEEVVETNNVSGPVR